MATIEARKNKSGEITSYRIIVSAGYDQAGKQIRHKKTWKPDPQKTARQNEKALARAAADFERSVELGYQLDNRQTVAQYLEYWLALGVTGGLAPSTVAKYRQISGRVVEGLGHLKLVDVTPQHINRFYQALTKPGVKQTRCTAVARPELEQVTGTRAKKEVIKQSGVSPKTVYAAYKGQAISSDSAQAIAKALGVELDAVFELSQPMETLSRKTLEHYSGLLRAMFGQAEKEMLIPYNPVTRATKPGSRSGKKEQRDVECYQLDELQAILAAAQEEPIKWRVAINLLAVTGCRRGELCGLRWDDLDWTAHTVEVCGQIIQDRGQPLRYASTKTGNVRTVAIPDALISLLREYRKWQMEYQLSLADKWQPSPYILIGQFGGPMSPNSLVQYLVRFKAKYNLPFAVHCHKFRHSAASLLIYAGADIVSVSKRLGHAQVSTTQNIYAHAIKQADLDNSDRLGQLLYGDVKRQA